jgi:hypothetical protein
MYRLSRSVGVGLALGLASGLLGGVGLTQLGGVAAATVAPTASPSGIRVVSTAEDPVPAMGAGMSPETASGMTIAYPYAGGTPVPAPDHTILVTGVGQADLKPDGSDRAAAQKKAIVDALADARAQADTIAAATGLSISGILSVSASVSPGYGIVPLATNGAGTSACPMPVPESGASTVKPVLPQPVCPPVYQPSLSVSLTVAYRVG